MILKINESTFKGEIEISSEATIFDAVDAITGALIAEGFSPGSIICGYEKMAKKNKGG